MSRLAVAAYLMIVACTPPAMRAGPLDPGTIDSDPRMECLPDPDIADSVFTTHYRRGLDLAAESLQVDAPTPPDERSSVNLQQWSEDVLGPWLERRQHTVQAARQELDLAAEETHRQRIMGGAVVGLIYEDVARIISAIPPPDELDSEPEIRDIYRNVMRGHARPYLEHARRAYSACAQNAREPSGMRHWSRWCAGREDRLPAPQGGRGNEPAIGETIVEVIVDD